MFNVCTTQTASSSKSIDFWLKNDFKVLLTKV